MADRDSAQPPVVNAYYPVTSERLFKIICRPSVDRLYFPADARGKNALIGADFNSLAKQISENLRKKISANLRETIPWAYLITRFGGLTFVLIAIGYREIPNPKPKIPNSILEFFEF